MPFAWVWAFKVIHDMINCFTKLFIICLTIFAEKNNSFWSKLACKGVLPNSPCTIHFEVLLFTPRSIQQNFKWNFSAILLFSQPHTPDPLSKKRYYHKIKPMKLNISRKQKFSLFLKRLYIAFCACSKKCFLHFIKFTIVIINTQISIISNHF